MCRPVLPPIRGKDGAGGLLPRAAADRTTTAGVVVRVGRLPVAVMEDGENAITETPKSTTKAASKATSSAEERRRGGMVEVLVLYKETSSQSTLLATGHNGLFSLQWL